MKTLTVIGWRRPEYLRRVLTALRRCVGIGEYSVFVIIDHGHLPTLEAAVETAADHWEVIQHATQLGCNEMTKRACSLGFERSDYHIHLEDDCLPARDCLSWFEWASRFRDDPTAFTVSAYSKEYGRLDAYGRRAWFTPWGWATWRDRWGEMLSWWRDEPQYPWAVQTGHWARQFRYEVHPTVARVQNIGCYGGNNVLPEQWRREHWNESFAGEATVTEWK